jgi:hypothetical protein
METELVRIDVYSLPYLYRFLRETLAIDPSSIPNPQENFFRLTIYPSVLVLSIYKYSILSIGREKELRRILGVDYNYLDVISCGALSMFRPVEIKESENIKIDLNYRREPDNVFRIGNIRFSLAPAGSFINEYNTSMDTYYDTKWLEEAFSRLKRAEGKSTKIYLGKMRSKVHDTIHFFESRLTIVGNVFYPLYKDKYRSNVQVPELTQFANIIKTYGNTFNEAVENIVALSRIAF